MAVKAFPSQIVPTRRKGIGVGLPMPIRLTEDGTPCAPGVIPAGWMGVAPIPLAIDSIRRIEVNAAPYDDCAILLEGGEGPARVKARDMGRSIGLLQSAKGALPSPPAP